MAQFYCTGPCGLFVGTGPGALFLGHGEKAPDINYTPKIEKVQCDLGGSVETDGIFGGMTARVTVTLNRYSETVLAQMQDRALAGLGGGGVFGVSTPGEIGTLLVTEGATFPLWLDFPYGAGGRAGKAAFSDLPPGLHFLAAYLEGPDDIMVGSATTKKARITFTCLRKITFNSSGATFTLVNTDMSGISGVAMT